MLCMVINTYLWSCSNCEHIKWWQNLCGHSQSLRRLQITQQCYFRTVLQWRYPQAAFHNFGIFQWIYSCYYIFPNCMIKPYNSSYHVCSQMALRRQIPRLMLQSLGCLVGHKLKMANRTCNPTDDEHQLTCLWNQSWYRFCWPKRTRDVKKLSLFSMSGVSLLEKYRRDVFIGRTCLIPTSE